MQIHRPKITQFENKEILYSKSSEIIIDSVLESVTENGSSRICISGGSTPFPLYKQLGQNLHFDWSNVEIYQADERYIDKNSDKSNQKNFIDSFSKESINLLKDVYFMNTDLPINETVTNYNEVIDSLDGVYFDISILGIGPDGHFASLFPGNDYLKHTDEKVIHTKAPKQFDIEDRISLTIESILNSKKLLVLLIGESKKHIINELIQGNKSATEFPAKFLLSHPNLHIFYSEK